MNTIGSRALYPNQPTQPQLAASQANRAATQASPQKAQTQKAAKAPRVGAATGRGRETSTAGNTEKASTTVA